MEHNTRIPVAASTKVIKDAKDFGPPHHPKTSYQDQEPLLPLQPMPLDPQLDPQPHPPSGPDILLPLTSDDQQISSTENSNLARSHPVLPDTVPSEDTTGEAHSEHQWPSKSTNGAIGTPVNGAEEAPVQQPHHHHLPPRDLTNPIEPPMPRIAKRSSPDSEEQTTPEAGKPDFQAKGVPLPHAKKDTSPATTTTPTPPTLVSTPSLIKESHTESPQKENMEPVAQPSPSKSKDAAPAKKKARTDTKKGASDTASLFQKICKYTNAAFLRVHTC